MFLSSPPKKGDICTPPKTKMEPKKRRFSLEDDFSFRTGVTFRFCSMLFFGSDHAKPSPTTSPSKICICPPTNPTCHSQILHCHSQNHSAALAHLTWWKGHGEGTNLALRLEVLTNQKRWLSTKTQPNIRLAILSLSSGLPPLQMSLIEVPDRLPQNSEFFWRTLNDFWRKISFS